MDFSGKADQINYRSASVNLVTVFSCGCSVQLTTNKTLAFSPSLIIRRIDVEWIGDQYIHYWRWSYRYLTWWNLKLGTLKTMGTA